MSTGEIGSKGALVEALRRFGDILQRADAASAELVEINENANDGSNEPAGVLAPCEFLVQYLGCYKWQTLGGRHSHSEAQRYAKECAPFNHVIRIVRVEVVEVIDGCGHA